MVIIAIIFLKRFSLIFKCIMWPNLIDIKTGIITHQTLLIKCQSKCPARLSWIKRMILKNTKNHAIVARRRDLFLKLSFRALAIKGPPIPNIPCEIPPMSNNLFWKNFGNFMLSKRIILRDKKISKPPSQTPKVLVLIYPKMKVPMIVPMMQIGNLGKKFLLSKDFKSEVAMNKLPKVPI